MKRLTLLLLVIVGCSAPDDTTPTIDVAINSPDTGADTTTPLADRCVTGASWSVGLPAFANRTEETGLTALDARGVRISAVDYDSDGFADLFVRRVGATADDFAGTRASWLLRNRGDGTFEDTTQTSGISAARFSGDENLGRPVEVAAFADLDGDGDLDLLTAFTNDGSNPEGAELMLNNGDGTFSFGSLQTPFRRAGIATSVGGLTWSDIDRDGRLDLFVGQGSVGASLLSDQLFTQNSDGSFEDATSRFGLQTEPWTLAALNSGAAHTNAWSTAACDLDNDGNPDLLAASYGRAPNKLFWNQMTTFENVSVLSNYAFDQRTDWSDNESARCWCSLNPADPECVGVPAPTRIVCETNDDAFRWNHGNDREPFRLGGNSGTTVCGDLNNDGALDLLTTEIVHWDVGASSDPSEILYNDGATPPVFDRPGNETTGLTRTHTVSSWNDGDITGALFDFDNDGRLDVLINSTDYDGTRALLYHQRDDGTFDAVPITDGIDHKSAHGVGIADFDRDGDLDVVIGHSRGRCSTGSHCYESPHARYFENVVGQNNNFVQLQLEGKPGTNRSAIGARVTIESGGLLQTQEVGGGHGHYGIQHDLTLHFGLGSSCDATVTIRWPNGDLTEQTFDVQAGYRYLITEGEAPSVVD